MWDGVSNALALKHIRSMAKGDHAFIYHSGDEKALVGLAKVVSDPYPDPKAGDPKLAVVDIEVGDPCRGRSPWPRSRRTPRSPSWAWSGCPASASFLCQPSSGSVSWGWQVPGDRGHGGAGLTGGTSELTPAHQEDRAGTRPRAVTPSRRR